MGIFDDIFGGNTNGAISSRSTMDALFCPTKSASRGRIELMKRIALVAATVVIALATVPAQAGHFEPVTGNQLPAIGTLSGSATPNAGNSVSPVVDTYGRTSGFTQNVIQAIASPGTVPQTLGALFGPHRSVLSYGAVCDGSTDDTSALRKAFNVGSNGGAYRVEIPAPATCAFKLADGNGPLVISMPYGIIDGTNQFGSRLLYTGSGTTGDIIQSGVAYGSGVNSGSTSAGNTQIANLTIDSSTKMTSGAALHVFNSQFFSLENVDFTRPQGANNLYTAFYAEQDDTIRLHNFYMQAQADCLAIAGNGAEPGANLQTGGATGPQYDIWADFGRINQCNIGVHVGGGWDGAYIDHVQVTNNNYDVVIDNALKTHPNQEVVFGAHAFLDFANYDTVYINDPLCQPGLMCLATFAGPMLHTGGNATTGVSGTINSGAAAPANSGNIIHIKAYPSGTVQIASPYLHRPANAMIYDEDQSSYLAVSPSTVFEGVPAGGGPVSYFLGTISGTTLTVTSVTYGKILVGQSLAGSGVTGGTTVTAATSGNPAQQQNCTSGSPCTFTVSTSQTVSSSAVMNTYNITATPTPYGIYATAPWTNILSLPTSMIAVTTPYTNVAADLQAPYGGLKVGLGTAKNTYGQVVVSNGGAEGAETGCGVSYVASNTCRELYYNRAGAAYINHITDGLSHSIRVGGTEVIGVGTGLTRLTSALSVSGHQYGTGSAPTVTASAGSATASTGINDNHGTINQSAAGTVTIKFAAAYTNAPDCLVSAQNGGATYSTAGGAAGTANLVVTLTAAAKFTYHCQGQ